MSSTFPIASERLVHVRLCEVCGAERTGIASRDWPHSASVCAACSDTVWLGIAVGTENLSPLRDPSRPRRPPRRTKRQREQQTAT